MKYKVIDVRPKSVVVQIEDGNRFVEIPIQSLQELEQEQDKAQKIMHELGLDTNQNA